MLNASTVQQLIERDQFKVYFKVQFNNSMLEINFIAEYFKYSLTTQY